MLRAVKERFDIIPIVVIEIDKGANPLTMKIAGPFAKTSCWDGHNYLQCMVYLVPTKTFSLDFVDYQRESTREIIWVNPMTSDEGKQLLGKYSDFEMVDTGLKAVDEADGVYGEERGYKALFDIVGTHPEDLIALALTSKDKRQHLLISWRSCQLALWPARSQASWDIYRRADL